MITPGTAPEGAYVPGTGFGQEYQGMSVEAARAQMTAPFQSAFGGAGNILIETLGGILNDVFNAVVAAAQTLGIVVTNVWNGLVDAVTGIFEGIASIFTGGGDGGPPAFTVGSTLADAYDKQQELIGKVDDLMEDNAGFINLCMSKTLNINWTANQWMMMPFDTYVTEHKNAEVGDIRLVTYSSTDYIPNLARGLGAAQMVSGGNGIIFNAPGVWSIDGNVTTKTNTDAFRYFEVDVLVFEVEKYQRWNGTHYQIVDEYSVSRFSYGAESQYITAGAVHKPVIIPDDGKIYAALLAVRYQTQKIWDVWGGTVWSSLSAVRHSIDTTDYAAPGEATGTVAITE